MVDPNERLPILRQVMPVFADPKCSRKEAMIRVAFIATYLFSLAAIAVEIADLKEEKKEYHYASIALDVGAMAATIVDSLADVEVAPKWWHYYPNCFFLASIGGVIADSTSTKKHIKLVGTIFAIATNAIGLFAQGHVDVVTRRCSWIRCG